MGPDLLRQRYRLVVHQIGLIAAIIGGYMLLPLLFLPATGAPGGHYRAFLAPGLALLLGGWWLHRRARPGEIVLRVQEGGLVVLGSWLLVCLASAWPLMAIERLNFTQAVFESVSGWTTTGLSVVDVTRAQPAILFWRALMQWAGGAGLAIIMLAALAGPPGMGLAVAEGRTDQLVPQIRASVRLVLILYASYALVGTLALWRAGMSGLEAFCHACAAVSTGGFGTRPDSLASWDSLRIEAILILLMILGNLNFVTAWLLLRGKFQAAARNGEVRLLAGLLVIGVGLGYAVFATTAYAPPAKSFRVALFETVSAATTTGFSTVGYGDWPAVLVFWLILLMIIGGGAGSTAGGLKQIRVWLLLLCSGRELGRLLRPRGEVREIRTWAGEHPRFLADAELLQVASFAALYLTTLALGTLVIAAYGYGLQESLFEFASALGTVGLSLGVTAADAPGGVLWVEIAGMLLGRLEFLIIFVAVARVARDLPHLLRRSAPTPP